MKQFGILNWQKNTHWQTGLVVISLLVLSVWLLPPSWVLARYDEAQSQRWQDHPGQVKIATVGNFSQVLFADNGDDLQLTQKQLNATQVKRAGRYIVWLERHDGFDQVVRYDLATKSELALTFTGNHRHPTINNRGQVAWEKWVGEEWHVVWFNGELIALVDAAFPAGVRPHFLPDALEYVSVMADGTELKHAVLINEAIQVAQDKMAEAVRAQRTGKSDDEGQDSDPRDQSPPELENVDQFLVTGQVQAVASPAAEVVNPSALPTPSDSTAIPTSTPTSIPEASSATEKVVSSTSAAELVE
jgi:hypothetical protein